MLKYEQKHCAVLRAGTSAGCASQAGFGSLRWDRAAAQGRGAAQHCRSSGAAHARLQQGCQGCLHPLLGASLHHNWRQPCWLFRLRIFRFTALLTVLQAESRALLPDPSLLWPSWALCLLPRTATAQWGHSVTNPGPALFTSKFLWILVCTWS